MPEIVRLKEETDWNKAGMGCAVLVSWLRDLVLLLIGLHFAIKYW